MKRLSLAVLVLAAGLLAAPVAHAQTAIPCSTLEGPYGCTIPHQQFDINGDGVVTPLDAQCVQRFNVELPSTDACPMGIVGENIDTSGVDPTLLPTCIQEFIATVPLDPGCAGA